jgi:hypothetical protein
VSRWKPASHLDFIFKYLQNDILVAEPDTLQASDTEFRDKNDEKRWWKGRLDLPTSGGKKSIYLYKVRPTDWRKTFSST